MTAPAARLIALAAAMGVALDPAAAGAMVALLDRIVLEEQNLTAIDVFAEGVERHLADSISALALPAVRAAGSIVDIGSGGGFPGIPLAIALPDCAVTLVESERKKADWLARAAGDLPNVRVVPERTETLAAAERERWDVATVRAVADMPTTLELAAPLVVPGGEAVLWRGPRDADEEARAARAAVELGFGPVAVTPVTPFEGAQRNLHAFPKAGPAPARFPRRPGRAAKRPLA